ncbi:hypothetical protein LepocDRAFT_00002930 [Leptothrix ochracea L12]|uniref:Cell division protein ZapD n=1 Tax=Leptothrix ochracea L12 TaxID=735332 RepID=I4Z5R9_9BURK|nr:cell division protein ZapD [Leptothrix ochracea]EIM31561.1 hypothetical protein LepocDRAFT_00002930 [Leptothrix ochracea L12]
MILYEYPFNESTRTMLRLEHLFERLDVLVARDAPVDHHFALATLFEIMDVSSRVDLKNDLLGDLERQRATLISYRGNPAISENALEQAITLVESASQALRGTVGKAGHALTANEWLMSIRSRINIPGGTCEFDLPAYYAWQQESPAKRRSDLEGWISVLRPLSDGLDVSLGLLRDAGSAQNVMARNGQFQHNLSAGRSYQLLRLRIDPSLKLVPEISGHRLMVSIRLMRADAEGRLRAVPEDAPLEITLCA